MQILTLFLKKIKVGVAVTPWVWAASGQLEMSTLKKSAFLYFVASIWKTGAIWTQGGHLEKHWNNLLRELKRKYIHRIINNVHTWV